MKSIGFIFANGQKNDTHHFGNDAYRLPAI